MVFSIIFVVLLIVIFGLFLLGMMVWYVLGNVFSIVRLRFNGVEK